MTFFKKYGLIVLVIIVFAAIVVATSLLKKEPGRRDSLPRDFAGWFELTIISRDDLPQELLEQYKLRMARAREAVLASPEQFDFRAFLEAGTLKKAVNDFADARDIWLFVNAKRPQNSVSFANLGDLYANFLNHPDAAEEMYLKAIANDPHDPGYVRNLLELYEYHVPEKLPTVEGIFAEALAREGNGSKTDFYIVLARYYELVQQPQKAIATLEKMKTAFPDDREVQKLANEQIKKLSSR